MSALPSLVSYLSREDGRHLQTALGVDLLKKESGEIFFFLIAITPYPSSLLHHYLCSINLAILKWPCYVEDGHSPTIPRILKGRKL